jgi:hypothetical protein
VKEAIETNAYRLAFVGVITEIKQIISADLSSCIVSVCKRDSDRVAHALVVISQVVVTTLERGFLEISRTK